MKYLLTFIIASLCLSIFAQEKEDGYAMFEINYIQADNSNIEGLWEKITTHNKKFHANEPYQANMWIVSTGPKSGQIVYSMGPLTFSDLDKRPSSDEHKEDWAKVTPHLKEGGNTSYWKMNQSLSYSPDTKNYNMVRVRFLDVKPFKWYRMKGMLENISKVIKEKFPENPWRVFTNPIWTKDEPYLAVATYFDNWAWMDRDANFRKSYEEVHGEGSWMTFMNEWEDIIDDAYDEFWERVPEASSR